VNLHLGLFRPPTLLERRAESAYLDSTGNGVVRRTRSGDKKQGVTFGRYVDDESV
jgi:hypothetical protein